MVIDQEMAIYCLLNVAPPSAPITMRMLGQRTTRGELHGANYFGQPGYTPTLTTVSHFLPLSLQAQYSPPSANKPAIVDRVKTELNCKNGLALCPCALSDL